MEEEEDVIKNCYYIGCCLIEGFEFEFLSDCLLVCWWMDRLAGKDGKFDEWYVYWVVCWYVNLLFEINDVEFDSLQFWRLLPFYLQFKLLTNKLQNLLYP